ncbi:RhtB (resistance to homoserine/threonine) family protein [Cytobacillus horneckiae]|uniref:LysE family translocator n=1 Tax=Cytobacillus horneckiae TaxID=549687 RepID=UPI0019CF5B4E|nr:LysE family translocator [Cytobacillus horneckiae]MBN6886534.1 LysE family translocator [Cytobacillus horneckiae]
MDNYLLFLTMSLLLVILPGPDTTLVIQSAVISGKKNGLLTVFGSVSGVLVHTTAAVLGLSAIIVKSALLFSILKYIGAIYLIYLGVMSFIAIKKGNNHNEAVQPKKAQKSFFLQGFTTNASNPKVAVFFLTFLPQFITSKEQALFQFLIMGLSYALITILWLILLVFLVSTISGWLKKPAVQNMIHGCTGAVLMIFGIRLVLEKQP